MSKLFYVYPEAGRVVLNQVSPDDSGELRRMLADHELPVSGEPPRQTGGAIFEVLTVALASGGAVTALVHVLHKFLDLRRDKSIYIETEDGLKG
ncbi:MAG: hypothetical protein LC808_11835 [Actinobacteria bacterium]|nr:hypothetical protein [Actinomycetota bacterium]